MCKSIYTCGGNIIIEVCQMATDIKKLEQMINTLPRGEYTLSAPESTTVYLMKIYRDDEKLNVLRAGFISIGFDRVEGIKGGLAFVRDLSIGRYTVGIIRAGDYVTWQITPVPEEAQA